MKNFKGRYKKKSYFEGWYFKNQNDNEIISFIPAFHIDDNGKKSVSLQVIINNTSDYITYPIDDFAVSSNEFAIRIAKNIFTEKGILLNIETEQTTVTGKLYYSSFVPLKYDIMGPFKYLPFMQCRHSVYSLAHNITGSLMVNGRRISFDQGLGYVEGDRGIEFPVDYMWTQCSWYDKNNNSVMISVADIPIGKVNFKGCIGVVFYRGREYRFATYLGVKIKKYCKNELWVQQRDFDLIDCKVRYRFMVNNNVFFDFVARGSFERGFTN